MELIVETSLLDDIKLKENITKARKAINFFMQSSPLYKSRGMDHGSFFIIGTESDAYTEKRPMHSHQKPCMSLIL